MDVQAGRKRRRTSMFSAAFEIAYDAPIAPKSEPMLPTVLEMFTTVFFSLFSTRPMNACVTYAGPATLVTNVFVKMSTSRLKAVSSPPRICEHVSDERCAAGSGHARLRRC